MPDSLPETDSLLEQVRERRRNGSVDEASVRRLLAALEDLRDGRFNRRLPERSDGLMGELARTYNQVAERNARLASELRRVRRTAGGDGRVTERLDGAGAAGSWADSYQDANALVDELVRPLTEVARVIEAVAEGDLSQRIDLRPSGGPLRGEFLRIGRTVNAMVDQLALFTAEVTRVAREVGTEGNLGGQAKVRGVSGSWKDLTDSVNSMASNLTNQVRDIAQVTTAVANGDLSRKITVDVKGELFELKNTINTMVDQLSAFADEVTRVAREVGTDGILGGQAQVRGVGGTWKDLTDNVNGMASNLTSQVRSIANVTTAVARGDLTQKIYVDARGEILELKNTINTMVDQLSSFAAEVTRVAREVGTEGKLGGQAEVEGVSGTWKKLTENVNQLASTLTNQLRAIAEVSTAVTRGDLTRHVAVEAFGEVAELKDNINQMIANLRETTQANEEQDWLKSNLARITGLLQGRRDLAEVTDIIMRELTPSVAAQYGAFFLAGDEPAAPLRLVASYGYAGRDDLPTQFHTGEGLVGQAAKERRSILVTAAPDDYIRVTSGLGSAAPVSIVVLPVPFEDSVLGVIELASLTRFTDVHLAFLDQLMELVGGSLYAILASSRTEELLGESQRLATELQEKQAELQAQQDALEERAEQLSQSSRYKSEFLANMSHELRTPLNSLLILSRLLSDNDEGNLSDAQVEFARTIHSSGTDLLQLINDILDLSKVEAGKMDVQVGDVSLTHIVDYVEATFRPLTTERSLDFELSVSGALPETIRTDEHRLQQVLRNLVSNAVKFTERGGVRLVVAPATPVQKARVGLDGRLIAFSVIDTGIGIPHDKLRSIFDAFQQADGTTSRRYGGTGLGLNISREIAHLLGGEIMATSTVGQGSEFTLLLPVEGVPGTVGAILPVQGGSPIPEHAAALSPADDTVLTGKTVLVVDDDVRNVFALTSVLERRGMKVLYAENGREGMAALESNGDVDLVLMDVMMPELDGNATTEAIRATPRFARLPIIALTAKAMQGDREKSLASGASDYVTKPVDVDRLLATMRLWLSPRE